MRQEDLLLPESVTVTFPSARAGRPEAAPYALSVSLASLSIPELLGCSGRAGFVRLLHSTAVGVHATEAGATPANDAELTALAQQIATDFYRHLAGRAEVCLSGVQSWLPSGLEDYTEFDHSGDHIVTRSRPCSWLSGPDDLSHASTLGGSALLASYGGISVSGPVQFIDATTTVSGGSVTLTDSTLTLTAFSELLLEDDTPLLLETEGGILLQLGVTLLDSSLWVGSPGGADLLLEDGSSALLLEDGLAILFEEADGLTISGSGRLTVQTPLELCGPVAWCYQTTSAVSTSQTGYTLPPAPVVRVPITTPGLTFHSFRPSYPGQTITLVNSGPEDATIAHQSPTETDPSFRVTTSSGGDLTWEAGAPITLWHDPQSQTWRTTAIPPTALPPDATLRLREGTSPGTPPSGYGDLWIDQSTGDLHYISDAGDDANLSQGSLPSTPPTTISLSAVPTWFLAATHTHADLTDANPTQDLAAYTLPAKAALHSWVVRTKTVGSGGGVAALVAQLLVGGSAAGASPTDGLSADNVNDQPDTVFKPVRSWAGTTAVSVRYTATGCDVADLTGGEWEVYLLLSTL